MKNQQQRRSSGRGNGRRIEHGRESNAWGEHGRRGSANSNYDGQDSDGRFQQNYGYGSQQYNNDYRDFTTQGRNSGLGNQGGYSTYGQPEGNNGQRRSADYSDRNSDQDYDRRDDNDWSDSYSKRDGVDRRNESDRGWESNRGKGPKGYSRSDDRIKEDVSEALSEDHELDASEIEVDVENGELTLSGTTATRKDKRLAEDLAESVSGVKNIENKIKVSSHSSLKKNKESESSTSKASESPAERTKSKAANGVHV